MELFYFVLFMLFFAVLAAGYFYLQRAKARDAAVVTDAPADAAPVAEAAAAETAPADEGTSAPMA